ncbi:MAG: sigma-54-dependent transcriptional regulator [Planctomycetota bacterium]|jgi:DNA-binding NtrC family response regulator
MSKILVVDDKEMMRDSVAATLSRRGHVVSAAPGGKAAIEKITRKRYDAVITDLQMPEMDGLELLGEIRAVDDQLPVIFMTAYGTVETAVAAMKKGAYDYITKPFSGDELLVAVERAVERRRLLKENQILRAAASTPASDTGSKHELVGSGPVMGELKEQLAKIADSHGTVLITGESGAGKEVAARRIHALSPRADQPFLAINCAALSTSLLESELFGHEKGAFTGADRLRKGRFELADGGTLLLDEISEIAPSVQAKLLRVLQEQSFERVGSSRSLAVDVRVIATTNRDLPAEVAKGSFRQDLFYRLNVLPLALPALRQHADDLPELVDHFLGLIA